MSFRLDAMSLVFSSNPLVSWFVRFLYSYGILYRDGVGRDGRRGDVPVPAGRAARRGLCARAPAHTRLPQGPSREIRA